MYERRRWREGEKILQAIKTNHGLCLYCNCVIQCVKFIKTILVLLFSSISHWFFYIAVCLQWVYLDLLLIVNMMLTQYHSVIIMIVRFYSFAKTKGKNDIEILLPLRRFQIWQKLLWIYENVWIDMSLLTNFQQLIEWIVVAVYVQCVHTLNVQMYGQSILNTAQTKKQTNKPNSETMLMSCERWHVCLVNSHFNVTRGRKPTKVKWVNIIGRKGEWERESGKG